MKKRYGNMCVTKKWFGKAYTSNFAYIDKNYEIQGISMAHGLTLEEQEIFRVFYGMWFDIPLPFQKGDIVKLGDTVGVIYSSTNWGEISKHIKEDGDISDMSANAYVIMEGSGGIGYEHFDPYYNIKYYKEELKGKDRILLAISNFLKGEISEDLLLNAYRLILLEEETKSLEESMHYTEEGMKLAGVAKEGSK